MRYWQGCRTIGTLKYSGRSIKCKSTKLPIRKFGGIDHMLWCWIGNGDVS